MRDVAPVEGGVVYRSRGEVYTSVGVPLLEVVNWV